MIFDTVGEKGNPRVVMLNGSFTSGSALIPLAERIADSCYVVLPTYDGHHKDGGEFTTRQGQAEKIMTYLAAEGISDIALLQGLSMGAEVALDLAVMLAESPDFTVRRCLFDGGPFFSFGPVMRAIMRKKFTGLIHGCQGKTPEEAWEHINANKMVNWMVKGDLEPYRSMIWDMAGDAPHMTDQSIANESDACYTFDFPEASPDVQATWTFSWSSNEPAHSSAKRIRKHYPHANYRDAGPLGHGGFALREPEAYADLLRALALEG